MAADSLALDYKKALAALLPRGPIWKAEDGTVLADELEIDARMLAKMQRLAEKLITEANLLTTVELLEEWEGVFELPHEGSYEERIAALNAKAQDGQLSRQQYINLCLLLGVEIEIREHYPFRFGISCFGGKYECGSQKMVFWWDVFVKSAKSDTALTKVQAFILKNKQSHTRVRFLDERISR